MIPLTTLYDEYIDRSNLTEQKNPFEYIVPPTSRGSEQLKQIETIAQELTDDFETKLRQRHQNQLFQKISKKFGEQRNISEDFKSDISKECADDCRLIKNEDA